jgi:4-hydroxyphenylpyruvate dioxygenase-like putative hemolysin
MITENESELGAESDQERDLEDRASLALDTRRDAGLEGLVGNLHAVIISTEPDHLVPAVYELLRYTGLSCVEAFFELGFQSYVLSTPGSASVIVRSRDLPENPFVELNKARLTGTLPNTRLETFVFDTNNLQDYIAIQKARGVEFLTPAPVESEHFSFIQTVPSRFTGNSLGFIQWYGDDRIYVPKIGTSIAPDIAKPAYRHLKNISVLDHTATRIRAQDRSAAILEFIALTNYHYDFAVHVKSLNSITSVTRRNPDDFAMVFTSGITRFTNNAKSGPTEKFIQNYGTRVHHMAFRTKNIEATVETLKKDGMAFLLDLVGSETEGLRQIFSEPSQYTLIVNEYIQRYGDFDGFFTRANVERLTQATEKQ